MFRDPLSFTQHSIKELDVLVRESLQKLGCNEAMLTDFDSHSTIKIEFEDCRAIHLCVEKDRLWLWSRFDETSINFSANAKIIIDLISEPFANIETSQPVLGKCEDGYEVKALVSTECIGDEERFSAVIENFYQLIKRFP